jgi:hypothetical protein
MGEDGGIVGIVGILSGKDVGIHEGTVLNIMILQASLAMTYSRDGHELTSGFKYGLQYIPHLALWRYSIALSLSRDCRREVSSL